jgi:hypothetical protein
VIVKSKFLCKNGSKLGSGRAQQYDWVERFIEGKLYDGEYETWSWESGYELNGGWRNYWVINEQGKKEKISRNIMRVLFHLEKCECEICVRDKKIENIIKEV